jgi:hypothetical protein
MAAKAKKGGMAKIAIYQPASEKLMAKNISNNERRENNIMKNVMKINESGISGNQSASISAKKREMKGEWRESAWRKWRGGSHRVIGASAWRGMALGWRRRRKMKAYLAQWRRRRRRK